MRLWLISSGKSRARIQRMIMSGSSMSKTKHKKRRKSRKRSGHPQRKHGKTRRGKMSKAERRKAFLKILPKINAGRRKRGLKPIKVK